MVSELSEVTIEPLRSGHGALLFDVLQADAIYEFLDERRPESVEQLEQRHAFMLDPDSPPDDQRWLNWMVTERGDLGSAVVGTVQATVMLDSSTAVIAYIISPERWGHGVASAAVRLMLDELDGVASARAYIDPANRRSAALVERLGFTPTADSPNDDGDLVFERSLVDWPVKSLQG